MIAASNPPPTPPFGQGTHVYTRTRLLGPHTRCTHHACTHLLGERAHMAGAAAPEAPTGPATSNSHCSTQEVHQATDAERTAGQMDVDFVVVWPESSAVNAGTAQTQCATLQGWCLFFPAGAACCEPDCCERCCCSGLGEFTSLRRLLAVLPITCRHEFLYSVRQMRPNSPRKLLKRLVRKGVCVCVFIFGSGSGTLRGVPVPSSNLR